MAKQTKPPTINTIKQNTNTRFELKEINNTINQHISSIQQKTTRAKTQIHKPYTNKQIRIQHQPQTKAIDKQIRTQLNKPEQNNCNTNTI